MILVTGATGTVGKELVQELIEMGQPVRVFTRDARKVARLEGRLEIAVGDLTTPETLEAAMTGVERAFLVTASTQQDVNAIQAAKRTGVHHLVKLSTIEAGHEPTIGHGKFHREREELIRASGLMWTFLRPTMFMSTTLAWAEMIRRQGAVYFPGGEGKVGVVDPWDIAAVAAVALSRSGYENQTFALTGPELLTIGDMVRTIGQVLGKPVNYVDVPESAEAENFMKAGMPEYAAHGLVQVFTAMRQGRFAYLTDAVESVTGRPARTFETWCREHTAAFQ